MKVEIDSTNVVSKEREFDGEIKTFYEQRGWLFLGEAKYPTEIIFGVDGPKGWPIGIYKIDVRESIYFKYSSPSFKKILTLIPERADIASVN